MLLSPFLLFISIPLAIFAAWTTTFAFSTLFLRALIVYAELAAVLIQNLFSPQSPSYRTSTFLKPSKQPPDSDPANPPRRRSVRRSSTATSASSNTGGGGGCATPKAPETSGFGIYGSEGPTRDFEGVGGWRIISSCSGGNNNNNGNGGDGDDDGGEDAADDAEDLLWTNMNSRLELPTMSMMTAGAEGRQHRNHRRSRTAGSLTSLPLPSSISPPTTTTNSSRARTPTSVYHGRSTSPQEYFRSRPPSSSSKSTTSLDTANFGRALLRHKPSSSSGSSHSSGRTLHITSSNG